MGIPIPMGTILLVDDEPDVLEITQEMLERLGFDVHASGRGSEALRWIGSHEGPVAAALLDLTMPEMSGDEVARRLRRLRPATPIVLMSGFREEAVRARRLDGLHARFLQKPFSSEDLGELLRTFGTAP